MKRVSLDYNERIDVGIILEQNWMVQNIARRLKGGKLIYCFSIDRDIYALEKGDTRYAFLQAHGSAPTACYVEEMRKRFAQKIYRIGTCGSLQDEINLGDIVLSAGAIRDEGTSDQYIGKYFPALSPPEIVMDIQRKLTSQGLRVYTGITWTTDGRFVESNEKIRSFSRLGVKNVDMETSALLIVCQMHKIPSVSIGIVTDRPIDDLHEGFKGRIRDLAETKRILAKRLYEIGLVIINSS